MRTILFIFIILFLLYILTTYVMFLFISRKININFLPMLKTIEKTLEPYQELIKKGNDWIKEMYDNNKIEDIYIKSKEGYKLHAILIENTNSKGIFIETHGYRSNASRDLYPSCHEYYKMGYSLLLIDCRSTDKSEGKYITFGIKESQDIIRWIKYINKRFPNHNIILAGISMGASSILMSLKRIKNDMNVKYVIADSAYISPYKEVLYCIKHYFHINGKLFIDMINFWCITIAKYSLKEENTISCIKKTNIPILFIHGTEDDFVQCINSKTNYEVYNGVKQLELFEKTTHGISYLVDPKRYIKIIKEFISK